MCQLLSVQGTSSAGSDRALAALLLLLSLFILLKRVQPWSMGLLSCGRVGVPATDQGL